MSVPEHSHADLEALRRRIDTLDAELVRLISERARISADVGQAKRNAGNGDTGAFRADRERAVYERVLEMNPGPLPREFLLAIFREIMSASIAVQMPTTVSLLGPEGSFSHMAAVSKFGSSVQYQQEKDFRDIFMSVSQGRAHYGIVPIENSLDGGINQVIDLFMESPLRVVSEIYLKIHQNLMAKDPKAPVRMICSHPQGFAQCRRWLSTHYADIERMEMPSTSAAAGRAASEPGVAAIASAMAARINGLDLIEQAIEDNPHNITRFFVVSRHAVAPSGHGDKTSLMLSIKDEPGALCSILTHFRDNGLNLTRIESRPSKMRAWEYFFFIDLEGHEEEPRVQQALHEVERLCRQVQILGSYPAAERLPMPVHGEVS